MKKMAIGAAANSEDRHLEQLERWTEGVRRYLSSADTSQLSKLLSGLDHVEIVDILAALDMDERKPVFDQLDTDKAAAVLHEIDEVTREEILESLSKEDLAEILDVMPHDDAADVVQDLPEDEAPGVIGLLEKADSESIRELIKYSDETAGGRMTDMYVAVEETKTVADALDEMKSAEVRNPVQVYITDTAGQLKGIVPINRLATAQRTRPVSELMNKKLITVRTSDDQEDVANVVTRYDLLAVPVVNADQILVGNITVDDVIDVIKEEATEDMYRLAGTDDDEMLEGSAFWAARVRLPWLLTTLLGGMLCAIIMKHFHSALGEQIVLLAFFVPAIMGMGGNIGIQSSTIVVRGMATERIDPNRMWRILLKQVRVGIIMGLVCGLMVGTIATAMGERYDLGLIVGIAMFAAIVVAATIGTIMPAIFRRLNIDPAIAAGPFVTISNDITGLLIYFTLALLLLKNL